MRAFSSVASITVHLALGVAVLFGTTQTGRSDPARPIERTMFFHPAAPLVEDNGRLSVPGSVTVVSPDFPSIPIPMMLPKTGVLIPPFSPLYSGAASNGGPNQPGGLEDVVTEERAEVLTAPLPVYPDLLRQAGVQGRVVLEAVIDTTGRVLSQSIAVVSATNPGFVAPARQALQATLFRPAMVAGKAVRMRVRIPYEFAIRNGTGRAR
jgi:TonB family protein